MSRIFHDFLQMHHRTGIPHHHVLGRRSSSRDNHLLRRSRTKGLNVFEVVGFIHRMPPTRLQKICQGAICVDDIMIYFTSEDWPTSPTYHRFWSNIKAIPRSMEPQTWLPLKSHHDHYHRRGKHPKGWTPLSFSKIGRGRKMPLVGLKLHRGSMVTLSIDTSKNL